MADSVPTSERRATEPETAARFVSSKQLAQMLGYRTDAMLRTWRCEGSPIPFSRLGRKILYDLRDVEAYLASTRRRSTSDGRERASASA